MLKAVFLLSNLPCPFSPSVVTTLASTFSKMLLLAISIELWFSPQPKTTFITDVSPLTFTNIANISDLNKLPHLLSFYILCIRFFFHLVIFCIFLLYDYPIFSLKIIDYFTIILFVSVEFFSIYQSIMLTDTFIFFLSKEGP